MGGETYENSVADDLEIFFEDIQLGRSPVSIAWTYFSPELTPKEMELVEIKNQEYMRSFKMLNNADVNETEMTLSTSSSKYVSAYCRRRTITIDSQTFPGANQESNSANDKKLTPAMHLNSTNSGKIKKLTDNKFEETVRTKGEFAKRKWWFFRSCRVSSCCRKREDSASLLMKQFDAGKFRRKKSEERKVLLRNLPPSMDDTLLYN